MIEQGVAGNVMPVSKILYRKQYKKDIQKRYTETGAQ